MYNLSKQEVKMLTSPGLRRYGICETRNLIKYEGFFLLFANKCSENVHRPKHVCFLSYLHSK